MGAAIGTDARKAREAWSNAERASYVASTGIICPEGEEAVQRFLADAIVVSPLPAPWVMHRSHKGEYFFVNRRTGIASWSHPLEPCLRELADVCRKCLALPLDLREAMISGLHEKWEADAQGEYLKWFSVEDASGQMYYCHQETGKAIWEHPAEAFLPAHYMRIMSIEMLRSDRYIMRIRSRPNATDNAGAVSILRRRCCRRRVKEPSQRVQAFYIGDPEGDSETEHWSHLSIDILDDPDADDDGYVTAESECEKEVDKEADQLSSCSTHCTEAFFIGDSDEDGSDAEDDPWPHLIDAAEEVFGGP